MSDKEFKTIIGLEIHCQLKTKSKMFCGCSNDAEGKEPNTVVCPVCLGMPGTLPVANKTALELVAKIGLALGSEIADLSWFDRKHYFYPDLPKGYQISQYQNPFCVGGSMQIGDKVVRFNRVHLEEDAGKLVHPAGSDVSYVDLNRAGTPLAEIVTEPDIESPQQAKEFMQELRNLLRAIGVSDADMEKGHLRCDANISVINGDKSSPIVEIKNLNSFKFVEKALSAEEKHLAETFSNWPEKKTKITRGFDSSKGETYSLREKEEAKDYRYFPEPDIPPIKLKEIIDLEKLKSEIENFKTSRETLSQHEVTSHEETQLKKESHVWDLFEKFITKYPDKSTLAKKLLLNEKSAGDLSVDQLNEIIILSKEKDLPSNIVRQIITESAGNDASPLAIFEEKYKSSSDDNADLIQKILDENEGAVEKYRAGKKEVIGFLIGQAMKELKGQGNPESIKRALIEKIGDF